MHGATQGKPLRAGGRGVTGTVVFHRQVGVTMEKSLRDWRRDILDLCLHPRPRLLHYQLPKRFAVTITNRQVFAVDNHPVALDKINFVQRNGMRTVNAHKAVGG